MTPSPDSTQSKKTYHLDCLDCAAEGDFPNISRSGAEGVAKVHEENTGHDVDVTEVEGDE